MLAVERKGVLREKNRKKIDRERKDSREVGLLYRERWSSAFKNEKLKIVSILVILVQAWFDPFKFQAQVEVLGA